MKVLMHVRDGQYLSGVMRKRSLFAFPVTLAVFQR